LFRRPYLSGRNPNTTDCTSYIDSLTTPEFFIILNSIVDSVAAAAAVGWNLENRAFVAIAG
jgi:hypothetical protein